MHEIVKYFILTEIRWCINRTKFDRLILLLRPHLATTATDRLSIQLYNWSTWSIGYRNLPPRPIAAAQPAAAAPQQQCHPLLSLPSLKQEPSLAATRRPKVLIFKLDPEAYSVNAAASWR